MTCGLQAQVMSAAELAIWARTDGLSPTDVQSALWQDRTLIKTWAMRGTLHLIAAADLPLFVAARAFHDTYQWDKYFEYFGISPSESEAFLAAVRHVLGSNPMTREQFSTAVADEVGSPELGKKLVSSSWGSLFKPAAFAGDLCFGPSQGRNITFVNPAKWLGKQHKPSSLDPYAALQEVARRYLHSYGPATPHDFALWWWGSGGRIVATNLFKSLRDELEDVDVEGWHGYALSHTIEQIKASRPSGSVNLLPLFDTYVLGTGRDIEPQLPKAYKPLVFRPQGWVTAVVLVDGYIRGVWEHKTNRSQTTITIRMFSPPTKQIKAGIEAEAARLSDFLNTKIALLYEALPR